MPQNLPTELSKPDALTRDDIIAHGQTIPAAPRIIAQLSEQLSDLDADLDDIARTLRMDPALTARVIRMSKSLMFGGGGSDIVNIDEALTRVGFSNVLRLVGAAGVTQLALGDLRLYGIDVETFQRCSLCHAIAAENVARALGEDAQSAYIAALLRGLGMVVIDRAAAAVISGSSLFTPTSGQSYADFERSLFGLTSVDATRILLDTWEFPGEIVAAIDLHHLATPSALSNRLACIVNVAGELAAAAGHGLPGDELHWNASPGKYDALGMSLESWDTLANETREQFANACDALRAN